MFFFQDLKKEIETLLNEPVTISNTPWGTSLYFYLRGWKVRISDHTSDFRGFNQIVVKEVHFSTFDLEAINAKIDRFEAMINTPWTKKVVTINIEAPYECAALAHLSRNPNARVISATQGDFVRRSKKGKDLYNFVVEVEFSEQIV